MVAFLNQVQFIVQSFASHCLVIDRVSARNGCNTPTCNLLDSEVVLHFWNTLTHLMAALFTSPTV